MAKIDSINLPSSKKLADEFSGAPLDFLKVVAAALMVGDHVNYVFFAHGANALWYLGRPVYPLFVFALVCNLMRLTPAADYIARLILLGVVSQPIYATLIGTDEGNTLFTLAVGAVLVVAIRPLHPLAQHLALFAGTATIFSLLFRVRVGLDYGLAGMLLPPALYLVLDGRWSHTVWLALLIFALNWFPEVAWMKPVRIACITGAGALVIGLAALALRGRARFLPRYALHVFYPGHLLVLMAIRYLI